MDDDPALTIPLPASPALSATESLPPPPLPPRPSIDDDEDYNNCHELDPNLRERHAHMVGLLDAAGSKALAATQAHLSLIADDLSLLKQMNVLVKNDLLHASVAVQDAVAQCAHARSLESLLASRLHLLDALADRADRVLARATLLDRVLDRALVDRGIAFPPLSSTHSSTTPTTSPLEDATAQGRRLFASLWSSRTG
ncbi:hypothetical protein BC828DRAFT_381842 [Blastocladiella britannica]|nr:hypothetical protein BC828DRAFT_381842 [Blastocladiella britannica]